MHSLKVGIDLVSRSVGKGLHGGGGRRKWVGPKGFECPGSRSFQLLSKDSDVTAHFCVTPFENSFSQGFYSSDLEKEVLS